MTEPTAVLAPVAGKQTVEVEVGGKTMRFESGHVALQAGGAVMVTYGETVVLVTATCSNKPREGIDFFPLTVDYEEKLYAAGKIPGGWIKREGRPPERAILTSRLIDRPIRPLFPEGFRNDVHIVGLCMSCDGENDPDVVALAGAGAALAVSDIPFESPVAGVRVGYVDGEYLINPTQTQLAESTMNLVVAGTRESITMVECGCEELSEDILLDAFQEAHKAIRQILDAIEELARKAGRPKREVPIYKPDPRLDELMRKYLTEDLRKAMRNSDKIARERAIDAVNDRDAFLARLTQEPEEVRNCLTELLEDPTNKDFSYVFKKIQEEILVSLILDEGIRPDGRRHDEIRPLSCQVGVLPRTHGSALFRRGQTQVLTTVTLGTLADEQLFDNVIGEPSRRYMHQYNFPSFSVGETRPIRSPGRREIGHGALAERALLPVVPDESDFPYAIRVVSEVLESNGSTSMASTCGSTLALMDAGVPLKAPVGGIAMGLVMKGDRYQVLTDIQGMEDALGEMDFKVAGTRDGVTALQMDIKLRGITQEILAKALAQAKEARMTILDVMEETIPAPRPDVSPHAPKILTLTVEPDKIKDIIGPGGRVINRIIADTGVKIDIEDDGRVFVASVDREAGRKAARMIEDLTREVEPGEVYTGKVMRIMDFGAFVEILPGREGMVHISQLAPYHVKKVEDVVKVGDEITVKVAEIDSLGRINLTRRGLFSEEEMARGEALRGEAREEDGRRDFRERGARGRGREERGERREREERGGREDYRPREREERGERREREERGGREDYRPREREERGERREREERGGREDYRPREREERGERREREERGREERGSEPGERGGLSSFRERSPSRERGQAPEARSRERAPEGEPAVRRRRRRRRTGGDE
jgi:polyribonucleotide nucleotidyltransferase